MEILRECQVGTKKVRDLNALHPAGRFNGTGLACSRNRSNAKCEDTIQNMPAEVAPVQISNGTTKNYSNAVELEII